MNNQTTVEMVSVIVAGVTYWFKSQQEAKEFLKEMKEQ